MIGFCAGATVTTDFATSLAAYVSKHPDEEVACVKGGPALSMARGMLLSRFAVGRSPALVMLDTDIVFTPDDVEAIVAQLGLGIGIVSGLYVDADGRPTAYQLDGSASYVRLGTGPWASNVVLDVAAVGMGFCAISRDVLDVVDAPRAFHHRQHPLGHELGEDVSFCRGVRQGGLRILLDLGVVVGHVKSRVI